jgi:hypothetical protein
MGVRRKMLGLVLVLVMLGSVISPAMAAGVSKEVNSGNTQTCPCIRSENVAIVEVKGLEKSMALARTLKLEETKKLIDYAGHVDFVHSEVKKVYSAFGSATVVSIKGSDAEIVTVFAPDGSIETYLWRLNSKTGEIEVFEVKGGEIITLSSSGFGECLYECVGGRTGVTSCIGSCAGCFAAIETGNVWAIIAACLPCAGCLGQGACCIGKYASEEPWGAGFCAAMFSTCMFGPPPSAAVACAIYEGCDGDCT